MRPFDETFDMRAYIQRRLMEMNQLESRRLLKNVTERLFLELCDEVAAQYRGLEQRVLDEAPLLTEGPAVITNLIDRKLYDVTDPFLLPMRSEDLEERRINTQELLTRLAAKQPFYLYTVFLKADYLETCIFDRPERIFRGAVKTERGEYTAFFHVRRNESYLRQAESLYEVFLANDLPWRSLCAPYLHKLFDVFIDSIENFDAEETILEATVDFEEYKPYIFYEQVPLWNLESVAVKTSAYPEPCLDKVNYEHRIFRHRFQPDTAYLVADPEVKIANIRWVKGDLLITCPNENPFEWHLYQCNPPRSKTYPNPAMSNAKRPAFSDRLAESFGQPLHTKLEIRRLIALFGYENALSFVDAALVPNSGPQETYCADAFIQDELRAGKWETSLRLDFRPADPDDYLNRDIMSFLVAHVQRRFPEYACCGRLV